MTKEAFHFFKTDIEYEIKSLTNVRDKLGADKQFATAAELDIRIKNLHWVKLRLDYALELYP